MPNQPEPIDVQFPTNGVAISSGFFPDRPKTSQIAHNVRAFDTISERQRGGSRAGITKFVNDQLGGTSGSFVYYDNLAGTNTWTAPADLSGTIIVEVWGAGGGPSPTAGGDPSGTAGGGGGGYSRLVAFAATPGASYSYTNGAGGSNGVDGTASSFNTVSAIANGGLADGTGATAGTGDFAFGGGNGGASGVGLGGGGGGSSGYFLGDGNNGSDGQALNIGGPGGTGFPEPSSTPQGAGGDGATGASGLEVAAGNGSNPGGGGGGGCADTGGIDPAWLSSGIGADGAIKITYTISNPIQHLAQLTVLDQDLLISSFENYDPSFIPDPSSNNFPNGYPPGSVPDGYGIRNPGRYIWPTGSAGMPSRFRPASPRERLKVTPSATTALDGTVAFLNVVLTNLPSGSPVPAGVVKVATYPKGRSGDGLSGTTDGSGLVSISVIENAYEGTVLYIISHQYTDTNGKKVTCSGTCSINWQANYTVSFAFLNQNPFQRVQTAYPNPSYYQATIRNNVTGKAGVGRKLYYNMLFDLHDGNGWRAPSGVPYVSGMSTVLLAPVPADLTGKYLFTINGDMWGAGFPNGGTGGLTSVTMKSWITSPVQKSGSGLNYQSPTITVEYFYWT